MIKKRVKEICRKSFARSIISLIALNFFLLINSSFACNLAFHEWNKLLSYQTELSAPLVIFNELEFLKTRYNPDQISELNCFIQTESSMMLLELFHSFKQGWIKKIPLRFLTSRPIDFVANKTSEILLGFSNCVLKVALFSDKNSNGRCKQLVLLHESEARTAFNNKGDLKVERFCARHWVTMKFWDFPVPEKIISISVYPVNGHGLALYENNMLSEKLLNAGLLMRQNEGLENVQGPTIPEL